MDVNVSLLERVQVRELLAEEVDRRVVVVRGAVVLGEVVGDGAVGELLLEDVLLVQEQDNVSVLKMCD